MDIKIVNCRVYVNLGQKYNFPNVIEMQEKQGWHLALKHTNLLLELVDKDVTKMCFSPIKSIQNIFFI